MPIATLLVSCWTLIKIWRKCPIFWIQWNVWRYGWEREKAQERLIGGRAALSVSSLKMYATLHSLNKLKYLGKSFVFNKIIKILISFPLSNQTLQSHASTDIAKNRLHLNDIRQIQSRSNTELCNQTGIESFWTYFVSYQLIFEKLCRLRRSAQDHFQVKPRVTYSDKIWNCSVCIQ